MIRVEVAYATPGRQEILSLEVAQGATLLQAAQASGIHERFPEIDLRSNAMGIFGRVVKNPGEQVVQDGQRIEIYRPLTIDPKQARLNRARKR